MNISVGSISNSGIAGLKNYAHFNLGWNLLPNCSVHRACKVLDSTSSGWEPASSYPCQSQYNCKTDRFSSSLNQ